MHVPKKLSMVIVRHRKGCFAKGSEHEWSGITKGHYWGNYAGTEGVRGNHHIWHKVLCNDPNCPAIKAVHSSVLANA